MPAQPSELSRNIPVAGFCTPAQNRWDWVLYVSIVVGFGLLVYTNVENALFDPLLAAAEAHRWARLIVYPSMLWIGMGTALLAFRTVLWYRYRPFRAADAEVAPSLTVVIPAYNEGAMVLQSIESVAAANYPRGRLEILVVDDGSKDDTWEYICMAAERHPDIVTAHRFPENRGKRAALAEGFRRARGDVVVTLDSDSVIEPDALLEIAGPFRDAKVGGVAGKVAVYNRRQGIIPRMLHVRYVLSFDVLRAVESAYGTVYCCPGALTAYRTAAVRKVLDEWVNQTFLGAPCTYGEDRALTNFLFASGYDTVYQRSAVVRTVVPSSYSKLCKMFLRWNRSYVREEARFMRIVWKRPPVPRAIALCERFITNSRYPVNYASLILLVYLVAGQPQMFLRFLATVGVVSLFYVSYYLRSEHSLDLLYGVLYSYFAAFALFWILPYALVTVRARSWLTR